MRTLALLLVAVVVVATPSCVGSTIHGLQPDAWFELLASDSPLPFAASDSIDYDGIQRLGRGAVLFVAMHAQDTGDRALAETMLREASRRETGIFRQRAVGLLADMLVADHDGPALVQLCRSGAAADLPPYRRAYLEATGLMWIEAWDQAQDALTALRSGFPAEAAQDAAELAASLFEAGFRAGQGNWVNEVASILAMDGSPRVYAALSRIAALVGSGPTADVVSAIDALGPRTMELVEARSLVGSKEFGPAVVAFRRYAAATEDAAALASRLRDEGSGAAATDDGAGKPLSPAAAGKLLLGLPRAAASDAARAMIAAARDEGAAGFAYIVATTADRGAKPSREYFDYYWHARFLRAQERWAEAQSWFARAAGRAATAAERDAAQWYAVEAAYKQSRRLAIKALARALDGSANPGYFSDLIEPISREALAARDGAALAAIDAASGQASARDGARIAYLCARAAGLGIITGADIEAAFGQRYTDASAYALERIQAAWDQRADPWYRVLAAYRLGKPLVEPLATEPQAEPGPAAQVSDKQPPQDDGVGVDGYALALAKFGLGARVRAELGPAYATLAPATVRSVASALSASGRHAQALRVIAWLYWRSSYAPTRADAELYWPRPYRQIFGEAASATGIDEFLLYGLARSESYFDPEAVSSSGALGLTQLLPATAAEMATRLRLTEYSLKDPADNVRLGSAYFARLLAGSGDRVMPAVFSYNAGPTRYRRWEAELGPLPGDLLLEVLSYAETRQYGRNTVLAALTYASLYGDADVRPYLGYLLGEAARPASAPTGH